MLLIAFGTRPEWIKIKPVVDAIQGRIPYRLLFTGQHADIIDDSIKNYEYSEIKITNDLSPNRLDSVCCSIMSQIDQHLDGVSHVMVQGDTTTVFATALACFHRKIPVVHLEAGLRTWDTDNPYPEEFNRQATGSIADIHLCPTLDAAHNLIKEHRKPYRTYVVGNTVLDNLAGQKSEGEDTILVTLHRRENHDDIMEWFTEINSLASKNKEYKWILPIHPNPNVIKHKSILKDVEVCDPLSHDELISVLKRCKVVITDSGGIQEESAFFRKPCIVCRKTTEREEGIGDFSWLCKSPDELENLFEEKKEYKINELLECPYGDGEASKKILKILKDVMK